jgi:hypothetical protein
VRRGRRGATRRTELPARSRARQRLTCSWQGATMRISIFGLGYVGTVTSFAPATQRSASISIRTRSLSSATG